MTSSDRRASSSDAVSGTLSKETNKSVRIPPEDDEKGTG